MTLGTGENGKPKDPYSAKDYVACLDTRPVPAFPCTHEGCTKEACLHRENVILASAEGITVYF